MIATDDGNHQIFFGVGNCSDEQTDSLFDVGQFVTASKCDGAKRGKR